MAKPTIFINDIDSWHKNGTFPTFNNTYDEESDTNSLTYQGGNIYERIYLPIKCTANQAVVFSAKFCSPSGYSCSYGDTKEYFAITSNKPSDTSALSSQTVVASTPLDGSASSTPVLYTVTYTPTTDTTLYLVIDFGYMVDGVQTSLIYQEITLEGAVPDISGIWYVEDGILKHDTLPQELTSLFTPPYPSNFWFVEDGILKTSQLPAELTSIFTAPYPPGYWYVEDGILKHDKLPDELHMGCFLNCGQLTVEMPVGLVDISEETFLGTHATIIRY